MKLKALKLIAIILSSVSVSYAQKFPNVQQISLRAPAGIKIDGKLLEWGENLQAYNPADRIFYAVSNDDNNLYLTVRCPGRFEDEKFLSGGLTFTVSHSVDNKARTKAADNVSVKFPLLVYKTVLNIMGPSNSYSNFNDDTIANRKQIDSLVAIANKKMTDAAKEIQVAGIKGIDDQQISVYNTQGIKAMAQFNRQMNFVYELAIPLKYLGLSVNDPVRFSYNIKLDAFVFEVHPGRFVGVSDDPPDLNLLWENSPSNFWGEYTLAKK
jgi:hypothetical protein